MKAYVQDPDDTLDYGFNWEPWLDGDTISNSTWIIESPIVGTGENFDDTTTVVFLSGGVHGSDYLMTNRITTAGGLTKDRSFELRIRNM